MVHALLHRCYKLPYANSADIPDTLRSELTGAAQSSLPTIGFSREAVIRQLLLLASFSLSPASLPACLSACLPACLLACLPACLSVCLSVCSASCNTFIKACYCCTKGLRTAYARTRSRWPC